MLWFSSDQHYGHKNIIGYSGRPFSSIEEHDRELILRWNAKVSDADTAYVLGDISFRKDVQTAEILRQLNGKKFLIPGNHDTPGRVGDLSQDNIFVLEKLVHFTTAPAVELVLCHYPIESWKSMRFGAIHLHGHSHGKSTKRPGRFDVGVDCWDYAPVSLGQILATGD